MNANLIQAGDAAGNCGSIRALDKTAWRHCPSMRLLHLNRDAQALAQQFAAVSSAGPENF